MAIATAITAGIITAVGTTAANIYASNKQSSAAERAGEQQSAANREALEFERERDLLDREQFEKTEAENAARWEQTRREEERRYNLEQQLSQQRYGESMAFEKQRYGERRSDMAPYRATGVQALQQLGALANLNISPSGAPEPPKGSAATMAELANMRAGS